jgi:hypothetical protein
MAAAKKKWLWRVFWLMLALSAMVCVFLAGHYFGERYAGERIEGRVLVGGHQVADAGLYETKFGDYLVVIGISRYLVRHEGDTWIVGVMAGDLNYFGDSVYTKADRLVGAFPPDVKTESWDPKPKVSLDHSTRTGIIEFLSIRNQPVSVEFKMR